MGSADPLLIVGIVLLIILMLVINVYLLVHWQHPDDQNESILARLLILYGFQLSAVSVLMLPLDVANDGGNPACDSQSMLTLSSTLYCGGINMYYLWESMFVMIYFTVIVLIPFATFYYESDSIDIMDPSLQKSRFWPAVMQESVLVVFFLIILLALFFTNQGTTNLPVTNFNFALDELSVEEYTFSESTRSNGVFLSPLLTLSNSQSNSLSSLATSNTDYISYPVTFPVYLIGLFGWLGWWFFALFAGVGLTTLPFDLTCEYFWRPHVLAPDELANMEVELQCY
mmetsp:Transcript_9110/g.13586  ORF Transcript_9110/g.13586 Transcript_9110/m.13586 type:complete len:285 (+) Transcript_9110:42-896(+)